MFSCWLVPVCLSYLHKVCGPKASGETDGEAAHVCFSAQTT